MNYLKTCLLATLISLVKPLNTANKKPAVVKSTKFALAFPIFQEDLISMPI